MSSQQTRTPLDRSPAGAEPETHWSEDTDFQWRAATELLIAMGVPRSTARLTGELRTSVAHLEEVDAHLPRDGKPLPEADRLTRNNAVDDVARAILPLAHATLERIRAEELRTEVVGVDYDLEYGSARMELQPFTVVDGQRVLVIDDVLATGGTASAAFELIERSGGLPTELCVLIELEGFGGRERLAGRRGDAVLTY